MLKDSKAFPVSLVNLVKLVLWVPEVQLVHLGSPVKMATLENLADLVREALLVVRVPVVSLEHLASLALKDSGATTVLMVSKELKAMLVSREKMVPMVKMALQVKLVPVASLERGDV